jgi:hypothetical protein
VGYFEGAIFAGRAHGEFVHGQLAHEHRTGLGQFGHHRGLVGGDEVFQDAGAAGGGHGSGAEHILDSQGDAAQRPALPVFPGNIGLFCLSQGTFPIQGQVGLNFGFDGFNPGKHRFGKGHRTHLAGLQETPGLVQG